MIQSNELRIGNWYQWYAEGKYYEYKVKDIDFCNGNMVNFSPIPITEEWLIRFGFNKEPMAYSKNIDSFGGGKRITFSGDYLYIIDSDTPKSIPTDIITIWNKDVIKNFYVHQLQNLYHALTGKELQSSPN